ncbi:MAG: MgtC/SapB family protein [Chthoniobacterales bacterium]|nr:MgtC/SapB family protein [Chthoniobacterales bacterium]
MDLALAQVHGGWILAAGFISLTALLVLSNIPRARLGKGSGMTTEIAVLLLYALGAFLVTGPLLLAVVLGGAIALLLHWKAALHSFASRLGDADMRSMMLFVFISMVILPVLPNEDFGPYGVFNPFEIWLMVVLIVGLSLAGYVAYKLLGARGGVVLAGILGGVISSTATTVSSARLVRGASKGVTLAALLFMIASTMTLLRVVAVIGVVAAGSFAALADSFLSVRR